MFRSREDFERFIRSQYPNAIMDTWSDTKYGRELQFYPNSEAMDTYTCVEKGGVLVILKEY